MSGVVNKLLDLFGVDYQADSTVEDFDEVEEIENVYTYEDEVQEEEQENERSIFKKINKNKVVSMPQVQQIKMKIAKPTTFDQAEDICKLLKEKNAIVLNLEYVNKDVARRIIDFVSGSVSALDGHIEKVSNSIFVVAPFNYDIVNDMTKEEIKSKFSASWIK